MKKRKISDSIISPTESTCFHLKDYNTASTPSDDHLVSSVTQPLSQKKFIFFKNQPALPCHIWWWQTSWLLFTASDDKDSITVRNLTASMTDWLSWNFHSNKGFLTLCVPSESMYQKDQKEKVPDLSQGTVKCKDTFMLSMSRQSQDKPRALFLQNYMIIKWTHKC